MDNKLIKTEIKDHVAVVTMDAPPVNAQSREFVEELIAVFEYALDRLEKLAEARGAFEDPAFVARYARLRLDLYDLGSTFERFAKVWRSGGELGADVSMLKTFTSELYQRITEEMLVVAGEEARFADDLEAGNAPIDAMNLFLDSRAPAIFGGSNEIQRNILAKAVLQLPG